MKKLLNKKLIGLILATLGLLIPLLVDMPGLDLPGRLALGIFLMAAFLWVFESVPIWGTSLLVILLQVGLLSNVSPLLERLETPTVQLQASPEGDGATFTFEIPAASLTESGAVQVATGDGAFRAQTVTVLPSSEGGRTRIQSEALQAGDAVAAEASHWRFSFKAPSYSQYYASLANPIVILFLGGFFLAASAVKFGLDQNLTRIILRIFGSRASLVLLGLLLTTAVLSAFMSNTASTAMMITMVIPIIRQLQADDPLRLAVVLAIPCGANIGGIATPIGTPPNAVVLGALAQNGVHIGFLQWMIIAVPLVVVALFVTWRALLVLFPPQKATLDIKIESRWDRSPAAIGTYIVFGLTILLWVTDSLHGVPASAIAFLPIGIMPLLHIIDKNDLRNFSWDVLWLMAGGLSLGITMRMGPAEWLIGLIDWSSMAPFVILVALGLIAYVFSNLISNTVAAAIIIPIAISIGLGDTAIVGFDFVKVSITIGILVSFSMLLPISTPPNAIAVASGIIETSHLTRIGIVVGIVGVIVTLLSGAVYWGFFLESFTQ